MKKQQIIEKIKAIISENGSIGTGEMQAEQSPVYKSVSKDHHFLIERFNWGTVTVVEYIHESEVSEFEVEYSDLTAFTLNEILKMVRQFVPSN